MTDYFNASDRLVTIFGGSGFIGRHIVRAFARQGWRVRVAVRRPDLAGFLMPNGTVGQVHAVQANLRYPESIGAAVIGAKIVVNAAGIKSQRGKQTYLTVHEEGSREIARAAKAAGADTLIQISGIGADAASPNPFIASKGRAEQAAREAFPELIVLRPSVVFGPEDDFLNRFAALAQMLWVAPVLSGGKAKLQPVYVGDVALAAVSALNGRAEPGKIYELGGPAVMTLRETMALTQRIVGRHRPMVALPQNLSHAIAGLTELAGAATLGKFPAALTMTRDQVALLDVDNVVSAAAAAEERTLHGLGVAPQGIEAIAPSFLWRFRRAGQYEPSRFA